MISPFPGMNPYLENPRLWPQVHKRLIVEIADAMNPQLLPQYWMSIEERVYQTTATNGEDSLLVGIPDNVVIQTSTTKTYPRATATASIAKVQPQIIKLPTPQPVKEWYLELQDAESKKVVTVIEILSPKNKRVGEGRQSYQSKRQQILASNTHLIEIDLLRQGKSLPMGSEDITSDYRILVSRSYQRPQADLYAFDLMTEIPAIPLPIAQQEKQITEPIIPLQEILNSIYQKAGYGLVIDYNLNPTPRLSKSATTWLEELLKEKGLRNI